MQRFDTFGINLKSKNGIISEPFSHCMQKGILVRYYTTAHANTQMAYYIQFRSSHQRHTLIHTKYIHTKHVFNNITGFKLHASQTNMSCRMK